VAKYDNLHVMRRDLDLSDDIQLRRASGSSAECPWLPPINFDCAGKMFRTPLALVLRGEGLGVRGNPATLASS
jgi:hypothetical protein